jgi:hypothetical protein
MDAVPSSSASARAETSTIAEKDRVTYKRAMVATLTILSALLIIHWYIGDATPNPL